MTKRKYFIFFVIMMVNLSIGCGKDNNATGRCLYGSGIYGGYSNCAENMKEKECKKKNGEFTKNPNFGEGEFSAPCGPGYQ